MKRTILFILLIIGISFSVSGQKSEKDKLCGIWYLKNQVSNNKLDTLNLVRSNVGKTYSEWNFKKEGLMSIGSESIDNNKSNRSTKVCTWELKRSNERYILLVSIEEILNKHKMKTIQEYFVLVLNNNTLKLEEGLTTVIGTLKKSKTLKD